MIHRRKFLLVSGTLASGAVLASLGCNNAADENKTDKDSTSTADNNPYSKSINEFGIQLWSVREDMARNPKDVIQQLTGFGYTLIESFDGEDGILWGMKPEEFQKHLDDNGAKMKTSHVNISQALDQKAEAGAKIGMEYFIVPWIGPQKTLDDYKKMADAWNKAGEVCKKHGLKLAYHNHDYSFQQIDGQYPQDVMMQNTDPALVEYQMDIYWVVTAGQDPVTWLKKYPNRWTSCHVKDRIKDAPATEKEASVDLGKGGVDFQKILHEASANGMKYYIVEQERFDGSTPLRSAERNAAYMKGLKI